MSAHTHDDEGAIAVDLANKIEEIFAGKPRSAALLAIGMLIGSAASDDQDPHHDTSNLDGMFRMLRLIALDEVRRRRRPA